jgi:Methylase of polypeptide chain release factors
MNIYEALNNSYTLLKNNSETNRLDSEILLSECLRIRNRLDLFLNLNRRLTEDQISIFFSLIRERAKM